MARPFELPDDFIDRAAERGLIAALARQPPLFWELLELLPEDAFAAEAEAYKSLADDIEHERPPTVPPDWSVADDPRATANRLRDLRECRIIAEVQQQIADRLYGDDRPPAKVLLDALDQAVARARSATRETPAGSLLWAGNLVGDVLADAEALRKRREETGDTIVGIRTGLTRLDDCLGGLRPGLTVLAGGPGAGKTTFACQLAMAATRAGMAALYVTYENAPKNILLKILCANARIPSTQVEKGMADLDVLRASAAQLRDALSALAIIEGDSKLVVARVQALVRRLRQRLGDRPCLLVYDYLQRGAHGSGYEHLRHNVSALAGNLRDLANATNCSVLALSSQNREAGGYGKGKGSAAIDSLKESGDLEYGADAILFLVRDAKRNVDPPARAMNLVVAKNRYGQSDISIRLVFRPDIGDIREAAAGGR